MNNSTWCAIQKATAVRSGALALGLALVVAACGSGDDEPVVEGPVGTQVADDGDGVEVTADRDSAAVTADGDGGDVAVTADDGDGPASPVASPLGAFLGDPTYGAVVSPEAGARQAEQAIERETLIAECMAGAGFDYVVVEPADVVRSTALTGVDGQAYDDGSMAWATRWGFGITTTRFSTEEVGPDLVGHEREGASAVVAVDPNVAVTASLAPDELERYLTTLYGGEEGAGTGTGIDDESGGGCLGEAIRSTEAVAFSFYEEFGADLDALYAAADADRRIEDAVGAVDDCLIDLGFAYRSRRDTFLAFDEQLGAVLAETSHPADALSDLEMATMSADEVDALLRRPRTITDAGRALLAELQTREIAQAVAVNGCGGGASLTELRSEVVAEYEQAFIDDNAERLAPFAAG